MTPEKTTTDKMATLLMSAEKRAEELELLNTKLYEAARLVLSNWNKFGQLAPSVRLLNEAVEEIDDHHDEIAAAEAGWEPRDNAWIRFTVAGEQLDPELCPTKVWIADGMIHALRAEDALTQDSFRDEVLKGGH
ncbi:hypothetical protein [Methylorubrum extorquens]|uniref:hypothetical protein n=1 Tax=Methylorubrum extorquens TaxID=408 RepID=UPI0020A2003F|nr:hypothetical protein [Methylorubrum extorquens]MCP1540112.1 uncharacterized protein YecE (DUF72 family) [Methylorubrum extorquens]